MLHIVNGNLLIDLIYNMIVIFFIEYKCDKDEVD